MTSTPHFCAHLLLRLGHVPQVPCTWYGPGLKGQIAQSGKHRLSTPAIQVRRAVANRQDFFLRSVQKTHNCNFSKITFAIKNSWSCHLLDKKSSGSYTLLDWVKWNFTKTNWPYGTCTWWMHDGIHTPLRESYQKYPATWWDHGSTEPCNMCRSKLMVKNNVNRPKIEETY